MLRYFRYYLILLTFLLSISLLFPLGMSYAQDANDPSDPVGQVRTMIEDGEKYLAKAQKRSVRRRSKKQLKLYLLAKIFSLLLSLDRIMLFHFKH